MTERAIIPLTELTLDDTNLAGGKGANLGELTRAGVPVSPGLVVTSDVYFAFLNGSGARGRIEQILSALDADDSTALDAGASEIQALLTEAPVSDEVVSAITQAYSAMGGGFVAVRSSATAEDLAVASFAGQQSTYLNISGEANVLKAVHRCWASLFEARAIHYRERAGFDHLKVGIAVVIQQMVESERSGIMFTINPVTGDKSSLVIEAIFGLGEAVVSGTVTPDMYVVDKNSGAILDRQVSAQEQQFVRLPDAPADEEPCGWAPLPFEVRAQQKLSDDQITELATIGSHLEAHFSRPQDVEWAWADGQFYILQARPVTAAG